MTKVTFLLVSVTHVRLQNILLDEFNWKADNFVKVMICKCFLLILEMCNYFRK